MKSGFNRFVVIFITLALVVVKSNAWPTKNPVIVKTNIVSIFFNSDLNLYLETVNLQKKRGLEVGLTYQIPKNLVRLFFTSMGSGPCRTSGGQYGLESLFLPSYLASHRGVSTILNYRFYTNDFRFFYGPGLRLGYRALRNGRYTNQETSGPGVGSSYNWYSADHYSTYSTLHLDLGYNNRGRKRIYFSVGAMVGVNFNFDKLTVHDWGSAIYSPFNITQDSTFMSSMPDLKPTRHTDGFHITPTLRLYMKIGYLAGKRIR